MRKSIRVKLETKFWNKLRQKALNSEITVEEEANFMLKEYVENIKTGVI